MNRNLTYPFTLLVAILITLPVSALAAPCEIGYSSMTGNDPCTPCAAGTFQSMGGQTSCAPCPIGKFQENTASSTCVNCLPGSYAEETGSSACTTCAAGTFTADQGSSICADCSAGTFQSSSGGTACATCATGSYSEASAALCTSLCQDGLVYEDEECDDGNEDNSDGCSATCTVETDALATANVEVDFDQLVIGDAINISNPHAAATIAALIKPVLKADAIALTCTCAWTLDPTTIGNISDANDCTTTLTLAEAGSGTLQLEENCNDQGALTFTQSLVVSSPAVSAPAASCSLLR